jgi:hypothetical protein
MSQIETTKLVEYVALGPDSDEISVSKLVMYVLLVPGEDDGVIPERQAHFYTQRIEN